MCFICFNHFVFCGFRLWDAVISIWITSQNHIQIQFSTFNTYGTYFYCFTTKILIILTILIYIKILQTSTAVITTLVEVSCLYVTFAFLRNGHGSTQIILKRKKKCYRFVFICNWFVLVYLKELTRKTLWVACYSQNLWCNHIKNVKGF